MSKKPIWIGLGVSASLCVFGVAAFMLADGPERVARWRHLEQHRQRHDAFMSGLDIPTAPHANQLPELDPDKPALWIHVDPEGLHVHTSALATHLFTRSEDLELGLLAREFTLSFPDGGWRYDPSSNDGPYNKSLMGYFTDSVYKPIHSEMRLPDIELYIVLDAEVSFETLSLILANLEQVSQSPVHFVLENPHVPERLHLLRHDGRRCCASPNAPDLVLPAVPDHFCAGFDTTILPARTEVILKPTPFEDKWGVPSFSVDSRGRVYRHEVYIDQEGTWHEGGFVLVAGDKSQEELALPGEPYHDFLGIEILPEKQDIYSSSARQMNGADIMKLYDHDVLRGNVCKEAYLWVREEMKWGDFLSIYTVMTVGQHRRDGGMVRLITTWSDEHNTGPKPFTHKLTLEDARHKLSRWRKKD